MVFRDMLSSWWWSKGRPLSLFGVLVHSGRVCRLPDRVNSGCRYKDLVGSVWSDGSGAAARRQAALNGGVGWFPRVSFAFSCFVGVLCTTV